MIKKDDSADDLQKQQQARLDELKAQEAARKKKLAKEETEAARARFGGAGFGGGNGDKKSLLGG